MPYKTKIKKPKPKRTELNVGKRKIPWVYIIYGVVVVAGIVAIGIGAATAAGPAPEVPIAEETPATDTSTETDTGDSFDYTGGITELQTVDDVVGTGEEAVVGSTVNVTYEGSLLDGTVFDSGDYSFTIGAGGVIQGWEQGIPGMHVGGSRTLTIPGSLGYGSTGSPDGSIPPDATLVFKVTLNSIEPAGGTTQ
jgi:hypothetical protein